MLYEQRVKYMEYRESGTKVKGAGFVKMERWGEAWNLQLQISGLPTSCTGEKGVYLCGGRQEILLGLVTMEQGKGRLELQIDDNQDPSGEGISVPEAERIRIPIGPEKEVVCILQDKPASRVEENRRKPGEGGRTTQPAEEEKSVQSTVGEGQPQPAMEEMQMQPTGGEMPMQSGEWERSMQPAMEEVPIQPTGEEVPVQPIGEESRIQSAGEEWSGQPVGVERPMQSVGEEMPMQSGEWGHPMQPVREESSMQPIGEESRMQSAVGGNRTQPVGENRPVQSVVEERSEQSASGEITNMAYGAADEKNRIKRNTAENIRQGEVQAVSAKEPLRSSRSVEVRRVEPRTGGRIESQRETGNWEKPEGPLRASSEEGERFQEQIQPYAFQTTLQPDKWEQLRAIYPPVRPFGDDREYLRISPGDFVILKDRSYRLANNSFLLHGYFNYKHLILHRSRQQGENIYFVGVPGNFFDKEKEVAILFGFESFECAREPAKDGDYGYYMMRVEL